MQQTSDSEGQKILKIHIKTENFLDEFQKVDISVFGTFFKR